MSALVSATDHREGGDGSVEEKVPLEALRGLAAILPHLPAEATLQHTPTLLIRIRLFSEKVCVILVFFIQNKCKNESMYKLNKI